MSDIVHIEIKWRSTYVWL